ncbi:MAG: hypothetical protein GKR94_25625 [Gammaproteobacteria bacterium]|nr:hypothetical protein [Gammaproteobacteria bacterium]
MDEKDTLRREYGPEDLGQGERGRYYERYRQGTNLVKLDPDVAAHFPTSKAVNEALRRLTAESSE